MAIPVTALHILRLMLQMETNLSQLQRDMRNNAITWKSWATAQTPDAPTIAAIAGFMNAAAAAYQQRLGWIATAQADSPNWAKVSTMWATLGGTAADYSNIITPLTAVANQLGPAPKTNYAQIITACDQIIAAINAPLTLWPE